MKVSIITTCYNRVATISQAIESVLAQDYADIEYIIVDGASTDGSVEAIKKYEDKISKFVSEPDGGMYEAINKGIRMATGDIVGLLHSDDFFCETNIVSKIVKQMRETGADFLYGDGLYVDHDNTDKVARHWVGGNYLIWKVRHGWLPLHPTCYIRRDVIERRGLYNETYKIASDSDFLLRYLLSGDITVTYLRQNIVKMRMGGLSTSNASRIRMWHEDVRMYRSHGLSPNLTKIEKMLWKVPQYIRAVLKL